MATNSKAELLNWLKEPGRLLGNDMVFALDKAKADALLTQEYIRRFKTTSYLPPVNGETAADNGYKVYMQNFVLDHPRLSFDNVDITSSKASLRMKIVGGNQVDLKQAGAHWYPRRIDSLDPLVGPELSLKLELSDVPGYVDDDGRIMLDLRNSDNFVLTFSDSNRIRQLGGDFFKELFRALPDEKRVWSLGAIERGADELLQPESFRLRTQRNPSAAFAPAAGVDQLDVDGAVLGLVRMVGNDGQQAVVPGPDYRYLIPAGSDEYSATVLFESSRVFFAAVLRQLKVVGLEGAQFLIEASEGGIAATATAGHILSAGAGRLHYQEFDALPGYSTALAVTAYASADNFRIPIDGNGSDSQSLNVVISRDGISLSMRCYFFVSYTVHEVVESYGVVAAKEFEGDYIVKLVLGLEASWVASGAAGPVLRLDSYHLGFDGVGGFEGPLSSNHNASLDGILSPAAVSEKVREALKFAGYSLVAERLDPKFREAVGRDLATSIQLGDVVDDIIKLNFGNALTAQDYHLPNDVACFGQINPSFTAFTITPLESTLTQGSKLQFATVPAKANITWSAESVEGSNDAPGSFDEAMYQAPPASGIQGDFTRVRITATDPSTGYRASALVSVVKNALGLSPLVEVCQVGDAGVSLKAGHVGQGELRWKVLGSAPHGHLAHATGQSNTSIPGGDLPGKAFVVEQVEVRNSQTNEYRTLCMITAMTGMRPTDVVIVKQDTHSGRVWLALSSGGQVGVSELSVVHGPGTTGQDAVGFYYQADGASTAPFCVVRAYWEPMPGLPFVFEGFIVLPLPLSEHSAAYQTLEQAGQQMLSRSTSTL